MFGVADYAESLELSDDGQWFVTTVHTKDGARELSHEQAMLWLRDHCYYEVLLTYAFRLRPKWRLAERHDFEYEDEELAQLYELGEKIFAPLEVPAPR